MDPLESPAEMGRRISAARGYAQLKKTQFSELMGVSVPTVDRWEEGEPGSVGRTKAERRQLAERIQAATNCPAEWLGLAETEARDVSLQRDVDALRGQVRELAELVVRGQLRPGKELDHLLGKLRATDQPPKQEPGEDRGQ